MPLSHRLRRQTTAALLLVASLGLVQPRTGGTFFDDAGIERVIRDLPADLCARDMVQRIITAVQEFTGNQHLSDDVTVVVAKVLPPR